MIRFLFFSLLFIASCRQATDQTPSTSSFLQTLKTDIILPGEKQPEVLKLLNWEGSILAITENAIYRYHNASWQMESVKGEIKTAVQDPSGRVWYITDEQIRTWQDNIQLELPARGLLSQCALWYDENTFYWGTSNGLYHWKNGWTSLPELKGISVNDLVRDAEGVLWVASDNGLWQKKGEKWANLDETLMAVGNEYRYFSLTTGNQGKNLILSAPYSIGVIAADGNHQVWRGTDGLPYGPAKVIRELDGELWIGTGRGLIRKGRGWSYYHGKRWLAADQVNDILEVKPGVKWVATSGGISELKDVELTLAQKAEYYADLIEKRHNRRGLINLSKLAIPGDLSTSYTENEDNDGLWTSCFLGAECFRYAVTQSTDARERAVRTFEALERLELITGIPGYPARSYALATDSIVQSRSPHPKYWHKSPDGQWVWLDDTSSDEITGHMFTLSLFYELVADDNQKERVVSLIDRIMTHILDSDFHLIDPDGKPTRWGIWHPDSLNHSPNWLYEKGLNSLQILSHLKTAFHYTQNPRYEETYRRLIEEHGYAQNAVEAKIYGPFETSHSDDILNFFPYYALFKYTENDPYRECYIRSLERTWAAVATDRMPVWNVIASALLGKNCGLEVAREELEQYPLDLIDWTMDNRHRWDLIQDPLVDRFGRMQAIHPIPTPESSVSRWNTNPKSLLSGKNGLTEETGTYYLFAYWMGRYYGFFD